ncbi:protein phosphatase 1J isoform X2 [Falco rusticolus]|uniref:protein phosphatase 1J isoform X2 n=1 Tax=Falco rusticolus TaxID=120794 RepID=UPI00188689F0|nr:protein phosphatase 1J isoform X2 [Falco rusticolus]
MLLRVRTAVAQLVAGLGAGAHPPAEPRGGGEGASPAGPPFCRPAFLQLTPEELRRADDHAGRAVQSPRDGRRRLPWSTGYAEVINAGKSQHNEDQACCEVVFVERRPSLRGRLPSREGSGELDGGRKGFYFHYWALFDGHAGSGAAVMASKRLHLHICEQLRDLVDILQDPSPPPVCLLHDARAGPAEPSRVPLTEDDREVPHDALPRFHLEKAVSHDSLVIGAIENAFKEMAFLRPELLGKEFTHLEFPRRIQPKELGKKMLYRDQNMNGWAYKKIEEDDLKFPLIYGEGKKARVMATIGVTRGLGDHDLKVFSSNVHIKPFLSCFPEVRVYDLTQYEHCPDDVLVLGTDGLWDVTNDKEVAGVVMEVLTNYEPNDPCRYTVVAQELVVRSRGVLKERGWRLANDKLGSGDDISVFVIPLGGPGNYT